METTQHIRRKDRIETARKNCLMKLEKRYHVLEVGQDKEENQKLGNDVDMEQEYIGKGHFGIRLVLAVLVLVVVFVVKKNEFSFKSINCQSVKSIVEYNNYIEKMEEKIQIYIEKTVNLKEEGK